MPKGDRLKLKADPVSYSDHTSYRYDKWRNEVAGRSCALCGHGYLNTIGIELVSHHIWPMAEYPGFRYDSNNSVVLCQDCHKFVHTAMKYGDLTSYDILAIKKRHQEKTIEAFAKELETLKVEW